jgi:hypothetical protein
VELEAGPPTADDDAGLGAAAAIPRRRTDRRPFSTWPVPEAFLHELAECATAQGAVLRVISDPVALAELMAAIREAAAAQEDVPGYRTELAMWSGRHADETGVPASNLLRDAPGGAPAAGRRFSEGELEPGSDEADGSTVLVLGTASDDTLSQLRAGEAMSAVLLHATELGLATCPLSQPLEIGSTRRVLRDRVLGGTLSPQIVIRVGWAPSGPPLPATPRRPVDETIEPLG